MLFLRNVLILTKQNQIHRMSEKCLFKGIIAKETNIKFQMKFSARIGRTRE